jgi:hypothetical protein
MKVLEKSIYVIATGIVPQSLFKNLKILENTLVVEIQKGILLQCIHFCFRPE